MNVWDYFVSFLSDSTLLKRIEQLEEMIRISSKKISVVITKIIDQPWKRNKEILWKSWLKCYFRFEI